MSFRVSGHGGGVQQAFVHPVAEYGSVVTMGAGAIQLSKLDSMQHLAEQLCSICDLSFENRPSCHKWDFKKYRFDVLKPPWFSCARL